MSIVELSPYERFKAKMKHKSMSTQATYEASLTQFRKANFIDSYELMLEGSKDELEERIRQYMTDKTYSTANKAFWALRTFYSANKIALNWDDDLKDYIPARVGVVNYRARNKAEITTLLKAADERERNAIFIMSTGGARLGTLVSLRIEDCIWIDQYGLYCLKGYPGGQESEYLFFISPEASKSLKKYIGKRSKGPLFVSKIESSFPADEASLARAIQRLSKSVNLYYPREVQTDHGFRHFFRTVLETSRIHDDFAERLMGHRKERLKKVYSHPEPLELLEASEYQKAIPSLTFGV